MNLQNSTGLDGFGVKEADISLKKMVQKMVIEDIIVINAGMYGSVLLRCALRLRI